MRELYRRPNPEPGEIVSRIVRALDQAARARLHDAAGVRSLDAVLQGSAGAAGAEVAPLPPVTPSGVAALDLAGQVQQLGRSALAADRVSSVTGALALEAIPPTVISSLEAGPAWADLDPDATLARFGRYTSEQQLSRLAGQYLAHDFERVFRYLVSRDLSDFVGEPGAPNVQAAGNLLERVGGFCRQETRLPGLGAHEADLQMLLGQPRAERVPRLEPVMREAVRAGLSHLGGGGPQ